MSLQDWRGSGNVIEKEVRSILVAQKRKDTSTEACRQWVREFIQALIPGWQPSRELTAKQARLVGRAFIQLQDYAPIKAPRQSGFHHKK